MMILALRKLVRPLAVTLLPFMLAFLVDARALGQERQEGKGRLENARWRVDGDVVVITYDLVSDPNLAYEVHVTLTRESNKSFRIVPKSVSGAIGKGKYAGARMEIRWEYKRDVAQELEGDDYTFEFAINVIQEQGGGSSWIYYVGGVGLAGVAAAVLLGGKKTSSESPGEATGQLPVPPFQRPTSQ